MDKFTNQMFCYWLQGYFEICAEPTLNKERVKLMQTNLTKITEKLGSFTGWLDRTLSALEQNDYNPVLITHFTPIIREELYNIFVHVIDNSYDTDKSKEHLLKVHNGTL